MCFVVGLFTRFLAVIITTLKQLFVMIYNSKYSLFSSYKL